MKKTVVVEGYDPKTIPAEVIQSPEPVVLKGLVKDWEIVKVASRSATAAVDYLKSHYNGKLSLVNIGHPHIEGRYFYNEDMSALNYDTQRMPIDEALDLILASETDPEHPSYYISSNGIDSHFPGLQLKNDLQLPRAVKDYPVYPPDVKIWIGTRSTATCHYDALENIACCVAGRRRFTLFPPAQFENLYFGPLSPTPGGQAISLVDFQNPDYEKHPNFKLAEQAGQVAELEPGDAVFIPSMWMHHVEGLSLFNILINYWWDDAPAYTGSGMNLLYHALLSLRDKPAHEKAAWKHLFDYYIFGDATRAAEHIPEPARGVLGPLTEASSRQLRAMIINKLNR
ncbi:cupin-like domain-containing protein [Cellvibrio japonicus]|uniref:cupin-like domain-containing protein n=1 Tax=Cellvibrio japonicus TaxID=155077 RepID=UPI001EE68436|nr:cupin-like domain-containing protein [Cellvibrio japonicus]